MHQALNNRPIFNFFSLLLMVFSHLQKVYVDKLIVADLKLDIQPLPFSLVSTSFLQIDLVLLKLFFLLDN